MRDAFTIKTACDASVVRNAARGEDLNVAGRHEIACVGPQGEIKWRDTIDNLVTAGKNLALDSFLAGAGAEAAVDSAAGTLLSADVFSGGDKRLHNEQAGHVPCPPSATIVGSPVVLQDAAGGLPWASGRHQSFQKSRKRGGSSGVSNGVLDAAPH
jgi:hypothetical protein